MGDLMRAQLIAAHVRAPDRRQVGPKYMELFGIGAYESLLAGVVKQGAIVDGVRLLRPLETVRLAETCFVTYRRRQRTGESEIYDREVRSMRRPADYDAPWMTTPKDVHALAQMVLSRWLAAAGQTIVHA